MKKRITGGGSSGGEGGQRGGEEPRKAINVFSRIRTAGTSIAAAAKNLVSTKKPAAAKSFAVTAAETTKSQDLEKLRTPLKKRKPFGKGNADDESRCRATLQSDGGVEVLPSTNVRE